MIIAEVAENNNEVDTKIIDQEIEQNETVEYIEVGESEEVEIAIDETMGYAGASDGNYAPVEHTHPINQIEKLDDTLHSLASSKEYHSTNSGFAEFRQWKPDGYYIKELTETGGVGYFVSLVKGTGSIYGDIYVDICQKKNDDGSISIADVYGVTVADSGFYGYQSADYDSLDSASTNKSNDPNYAKVCLLGNVKVRVTGETLDTIKIGDFVVPNELGYAQKADNNVGFKVISKGTIEKGWNYVSIALVPQNDNTSRVMKELENAKGSLNNVTLELDNMGNKIDNIFNSSVDISNKVDGLEDILNETVPKIDEQIRISQEASEKAEEIAKEAKETMNTVASQYSEALNKAKDAHELIYGNDENDGILSEIDDLKDNMQHLAEWQGEDGSKGVAGFVAQANKDRTQLATLTSAFGTKGSDITAIIQKIDENGAAIQHLVGHVDKYALGKYSPAYGFSYDETTIIQPGTIYVSTNNHTEQYAVKDGEPITVEFVLGKIYEWAFGDVPDVYTWVELSNAYTWTTLEDVVATKDGDLWYCWQGIYSGDKLLYDPGTLYLWDDTKKIWIAVASINDNPTSRVVGLVNQSARKLMSVYEDLEGNVSSLEQTVNGISTTVQNEIKKEISTINQTAEEIMMGIYTPDSSSSLGLLLDGMTSNAINANVVKIKTVAHTPHLNKVRYNEAPRWNGEEFVPVGESNESGRYYFDPDDTAPYTYYYYGVDDEHYEVYGINNITMASLNSRVTDHDAMYEEYTRFKADTSETFTSISQKSDANEAKIASVASGEYVICTDVNLQPTETFPSERYLSAPKWNGKSFVFSGDKVENGIYCMKSDDHTCYYKLFYNGTTISSYEKYELASSGSSALVQRVTKNSSSIGMVVEDNKVKASIIAEAINGSGSNVSIMANKINFDGFTTFANSSDAMAKVEVQYALSDSMTTPPESGWSITAPQWTSGKYMWQKTVAIYANGATKDSAATCISGAKGADGTGVSIKNTAYVDEDVTDSSIGKLFELYSDEECSVQIADIAEGDAYLVDGYLFVYSGNNYQFSCTGKIQGPSGADGYTPIKGKDYFDGESGAGINSVTVEYAKSATLDIPRDDGEDSVWKPTITELGEIGESEYLWTRTITDYTDDRDDTVAYTYSRQGETGKPGTSVTIESIQYQEGDSPTDMPTGDWSDNIIEVAEGKYLWSKTTFSDGNIAHGVAKQGAKGEQGIGVKEVIALYCLFTSKIYAPDVEKDEWTQTQPEWEVGKYIWTCSKITWTDGSITYTDPVFAGSLNSANEAANNAQGTANDAKDMANNANNIAQTTQDSLNARIVEWCVDSNTTIIDGSKIYAGSISSLQLNTNAIMSLNYDINNGDTFSNSGTFFNLEDGSITSKNFAIDADGNATIAGKITATSGYIGNAENGFVIVKLPDSSWYSLSNNQSLYSGNLDDEGNKTLTAGVYLGPDGIGLGNGNFYVDNMGNISMTGNVTLGGNITWNMKNSPVKSQYSSNDIVITEDYDPENSRIWHDTFQAGDKYMRITFDGGQTWNTPTKIVGTDATVTPETVFNALTEDGKIQGFFGNKDTDGNMELYINAEYIRSGTMSGMKFTDTTGVGILELSSREWDFGDEKVRYPALIFGSQNSVGFEIYPNSTSGGPWNMIFNDSLLMQSTTYDEFILHGTWDFRSCNVENMTIEDTDLSLDGTTIYGNVTFDSDGSFLFDGFVDFNNQTEFNKVVVFNNTVDFESATVTGLGLPLVFS